MPGMGHTIKALRVRGSKQILVSRHCVAYLRVRIPPGSPCQRALQLQQRPRTGRFVPATYSEPKKISVSPQSSGWGTRAPAPFAVSSRSESGSTTEHRQAEQMMHMSHGGPISFAARRNNRNFCIAEWSRSKQSYNAQWLFSGMQ